MRPTPKQAPRILWDRGSNETVNFRPQPLRDSPLPRTSNTPNIELSSAADYAQSPRFPTGRHSQSQPASKATAPTICYVDALMPEPPSSDPHLPLRSWNRLLPGPQKTLYTKGDTLRRERMGSTLIFLVGQ